MENKKVMIVDDDKEFLEELEDVLADSGYDLVAVTDSIKVLDVALRIKPDVIIMDLKMPYRSGFQLADELRRYSELQHVPILAMTAFFKNDYTQLMDSCGIKKCLQKPFNPLDVIAEIERAMV